MCEAPLLASMHLRSHPVAAPGGWRTIARGEAIQEGMLGIWQTGDDAPGEYTLRLRVTTREGILLEQHVWVRLEREAGSGN